VFGSRGNHTVRSVARSAQSRCASGDVKPKADAGKRGDILTAQEREEIDKLRKYQPRITTG
jgi:hypothetical protein